MVALWTTVSVVCLVMALGYAIYKGVTSAIAPTGSEPTPAQFGREIAVFLVLLVSSFVTATVARVSIPADGIRFTVSWQPVKESESLPPIPKAED